MSKIKAAIIGTVLGIFVIVVLVGSFLVPIVNDSTDADDTLEVLVIAGQSNAAYGGFVNPTLVNQEIPKPSTNVYYYGTASQPIWYGYPSNPTYDTTFESYDIYPMINNGSWAIGGYEPGMAYAISEKSNCDVLIINVGISSASIQYLQPDNTGGAYVNDVIEDALSKVDSKYKIDKVGYMWLQGESNSSTAVDTYISYFDTINDWYYSKGFDTCYMVQTRPYNGGNASIAQLQICSSDYSVLLASTAPDTFTVDNGLMVSDNLHYSQKGRDVICNDVASQLRVSYHFDNEGTNLLIAIPFVVIAALLIVVVRIIISRGE